MWREYDTTADTGIEILENSLADLFQTAAVAFTEMATDIERLVHTATRTITVSNESEELLLVDWLNEFLYLLETKDLLPIGFYDFQIYENAIAGTITVTANVMFGRFVYGMHDSKTEIKAITYHKLEVEKRTGGWYGRVVFDI